MLEDWKNHHDDCSVSVNDAVGATIWAVEMADEEKEDGTTTWEAADMLHTLVSENGLVASSVLNVDLVEEMADKRMSHIDGQAAGGGFVVKDVFPRESRKPGVTPGAKKLGGRVNVSLGIGSMGSEEVDVSISQPFAIEDVTFSKRGGEGTTIFVNEQKMDTIKADVRRNKVGEINALGATGGLHQIKMRVDMPDGTAFVLEGSFTFAKTSSSARVQRNKDTGFSDYAKGGVKKLRFRARHHASRAAASVRKLPQFVRITGHDIRGVEGSAVFGKSRKTNSAVYTLRSFAMHIPSGIEGEKGLPRLDQTRIDASAQAKPVPVDAECLEDVIALADAMADHHDRLKASFIGAQQQPPSAEAVTNIATIRGQLNEAARIHSVLIQHANALHEEETGDRDQDDISVEVHEAVNQAQTMIGLTLRERWGRMRNVRGTRKGLSGKSVDALRNAFISDVVALRNARAVGQVGTQYLQSARILQEEILKRRINLANDAELSGYMRELQTMRSNQRAVRTGKHKVARYERAQETSRQKEALEELKRNGAITRTAGLGDIDKDDPLPPTPSDEADTATTTTTPVPGTPTANQSAIRPMGRRVV